LNAWARRNAVNNNVEKGVPIVKVIWKKCFLCDIKKQLWNVFDVLFFFIAKANNYFTLLLETELLEEMLQLIPAVNVFNADLWFVWQV